MLHSRCLRSGLLVLVQRYLGGLDDVGQDAQLLGGAAVQRIGQLGQDTAALAAAVEQQVIRLHAKGAGQFHNVEADALSVSGAVGGSSLKQVTAGDLEIASALGSIKLEDVWADNYIKAGLILHTSGRIQKR